MCTVGKRSYPYSTLIAQPTGTCILRITQVAVLFNWSTLFSVGTFILSMVKRRIFKKGQEFEGRKLHVKPTHSKLALVLLHAAFMDFILLIVVMVKSFFSDLGYSIM